MAVQIIRAQKVWLAQFDVSGDLRGLAINDGVELAEATALGDTGRRRRAGLFAPALHLEGFWNGGANAIDDVLFARVGVEDAPLSIGAETGADGEIAYMLRLLVGEYVPGAPIGEMFGFSVSAHGSSGERLVRGTILHNATRTATVNGTGRQLGTVSATQKIYAALHVTAASGTTPTLDVTVQSDDNSAFTTPTARITFAQAVASTSEWKSAAGAITDDWWRIVATIGGTGPSFTFIATVGIL